MAWQYLKIPKGEEVSPAYLPSGEVTIENRLTFKPNFDRVEDIVEEGDIIWALTTGGILKYNQKNNEVKIYSVKDGLTGDGYINMIKRGDYIWVATNHGISRLNIKNEEIKNYFKKPVIENDSWADIFYEFDYEVMDGLSSNANLKLFLDPYTNDLWAASFNGISKYQDIKDDWISFGKAEDVNLNKGITNIVFNKDFVIADISPGIDFGGIVAFDRKENKWVALSEKEGFNLQKNDFHKLVTNENKFWVESRPIGYTSCGEKDKIKASAILSYSKMDGWDSEKELNKQISLNEEVAEMEYTQPFLIIYLKEVCDGNTIEGKAKLIKFNTVKNEVEEVKIVDNYDQIKDEERRQKETEISELIARIEKIKGEPARKEILFRIDDELLFNILPTFKRTNIFDGENELKQFNEELIENREANIFWTDLKNKEREFLENYNLSDRYFVPMECNKFNSKGNYIYLRTNGEDGIGGSDRSLIVRYNKSKKEFTLLRDTNYTGEDVSDLITLPSFMRIGTFICNDNYYFNFRKRGVCNYDFEHQKTTCFDENNYKDAIKLYISDDTKQYFLTGDYQLGMFDIDNLRYQYLVLENEKDVGIDFKTADLELKDIEGNTLYFTGKEEGYLFVYDKELKKWNKFWIPEEDRGRIEEVKAFKDTVWIITDEGIFDNIVYIIEKKDTNPRRVNINNGIITTGGRVVRDSSSMWGSEIIKMKDKLFIVGENGLWIFE